LNKNLINQIIKEENYNENEDDDFYINININNHYRKLSEDITNIRNRENNKNKTNNKSNLSLENLYLTENEDLDSAKSAEGHIFNNKINKICHNRSKSVETTKFRLPIVNKNKIR